MLLAVDVGNSAVKGGLFDRSELVRVFTISTAEFEQDEVPSASEWRDALAAHLQDVPVEAAGIASVVPRTAETLTEVLADITSTSVTKLGPALPLPFDLAYETPDTLGTDRLAAAAGGWIHLGHSQNPARSVIVVDAGTAVTCEVVRRDGVYLGGTITAGPNLVQQSLRAGTAQLPEVPLRLPQTALGTSTQTALQNGILWSLIDGVRGMTTRLAAMLPDDPETVLTGGWAPLLNQHLDNAAHDPHLVLRGIKVLVDTSR